ncbi:hypothetical protein DPEC_G00291260 [Dallia pectoralis]|uniref:Uncharacterized protein n=1 Tax=Dallia pectoralis TaxID=75939 RepID=A0ACC2FHS7_DALPE|nr:hypothetical protein DPEC_G00291260 [Dallia pectoralis]
MQREKSVKAKEVIESLCKLLSSLGVECVPSAETFRRAKFNKDEDVVVEFWKLLHNVLLKACLLECPCQTQSDQETQSRHVRSALWHCGYGASWIFGQKPGSGGYTSEVGSRDLLVAFGWVLSSQRLVDVMLNARAIQLDTLSLPPVVSLCIPKTRGSPGAVPGEEGPKASEVKQSEDHLLRRLQWHYGKLRFQWRSLLSIQEERATILHKVLSWTSTLSTSQSPRSAVSGPGSAVLRKEVERLRTLVRLQEAYLEWKRQEPLFWCWMDSVLDCQLAEPCTDDGAGDKSPSSTVVNRSCFHVDKDTDELERLDGQLLRLQTGLREKRRQLTAQVTQLTAQVTQLTAQSRNVSSDVTELKDIEKRVAFRIQALVESCTCPSTSGRTGYRPSLQGPETLPTHCQPSRPGTGSSAWDEAVPPDREEGMIRDQIGASSLIRELRQREELLLEKLTRMSQARREEIQEQTASRLEGVGVVLIPPLPLKR